MEIEEVKKGVAAIVREELPTGYSAFFFGSRIAGTNAPTSDLDVGIEGKTTLPEHVLRTIRARCDALQTLYTIDVVDFSTASDDFKQVAQKHIERIV